MTNSIIPMAGTLEILWHIAGMGLVIALGALWSWVIFTSWQRARTEQIHHGWSSSARIPNLSVPDASCAAARPAVHEMGHCHRAQPSHLHRHGF